LNWRVVLKLVSTLLNGEAAEGCYSILLSLLERKRNGLEWPRDKAELEKAWRYLVAYTSVCSNVLERPARDGEQAEKFRNLLMLDARLRNAWKRLVRTKALPSDDDSQVALDDGDQRYSWLTAYHVLT
jgi:hypothetical protein